MSTMPPPPPPGMPPAPPSPGPYGYGGGPVVGLPRGRGMATAALVCGIAAIPLCFLLVVGVVALVLGLVAASQIKNGPYPHDGLGKARAGWILGLIATVLFAAFIVVAVTGVFDEVSVDDLEEGDCLNFDASDVEGTEIERLPQTECDEPHTAEVYLVEDLDLEADEYPGESEIVPEIQRRCSDAVAGYVDPSENPEDFEIFFLQPSERSWELGDRGLVCMVTTADGSTISRSVAADD